MADFRRPEQFEQASETDTDNSPTNIYKASWQRRLDRRLAKSLPFLHHVVTRSVRYVNGPPRHDLEGPEPYIHLTFTLNNRTRSFALEPLLTCATRPLTHLLLLIIFVAAYVVGLSFLTRAQFFLIPASDFIGCTSTYWLANDGCGLDGQECAPFSNSTLDFRCPAQCSSVVLANRRAVGAQEPEFVPLVVGGEGMTYRGDSFICAAAIHAGIIKDSGGGCGRLSLIGDHSVFPSSTAHGITSTGFPTQFPLSYTLSSQTSLTHCNDLRNVALAYNVIMLAILFFVLRPKSIVLYWSMVCVGYWHVTFFSQPRDNPPPISDALGTFLPLLFVAYTIWRVAFRFVLPSFKNMPIERGVWYMGAFWPGVLYNITTGKIPIDRLLASDIDQRPGALTALIILVIVIAILVLNQLRVIRKTGWLLHYVGLYLIGGAVVLIFSLLPGLELRVHHYIAALLFLPITAFPTRLSAVYQAFCLGMLLNGLAAFDFDSMFQTAAQLRRDGAFGSALPILTTNSSTFSATIPLSNQTISWLPITQNLSDLGWDGFSLLVDDVERFVGAANNFSLSSLTLNASLPHFFRLAYQQSGTSGDYIKAATLWPNGTWIDPRPGPS